MSYEVEFRLSVGAQYEYVNVRVSATDAADLARQLDAINDTDGLNIGHMQAALSGVVRHGYDNPGSSPIEKAPPSVYDTPIDLRAPETLIQEELGGRVVAVQEQAAEAPSKPWEVTLPAPPKPWEAVRDEVKALAAESKAATPAVDQSFPDW